MSGYPPRRREESFSELKRYRRSTNPSKPSLPSPNKTKKKKRRRRRRRKEAEEKKGKKELDERIQNNLSKEQFDSRDTRFSPRFSLLQTPFASQRARPIRITEHESKGEEGEERESQSGESPGYSGGGLRAPPIYSKNPWKVARFTRCENRLTHPLPVLRMPVFARTFFSAHTSAHSSVSGRLTPPPFQPRDRFRYSLRSKLAVATPGASLASSLAPLSDFNVVRLRASNQKHERYFCTWSPPLLLPLSHILRKPDPPNSVHSLPLHPSPPRSFLVNPTVFEDTYIYIYRVFRAFSIHVYMRACICFSYTRTDACTRTGGTL